MAAIDISGLVKTFGHVRALDGLDLTVARRRGARLPRARTAPASRPPSACCSACCAPTPGRSGCSAATRGATPSTLHRRLAYVPGDVNLWPNLTGGEAIDLLGRLRGGLDPARRAELIERFELDPTKKGRTYSKGNRQKVALVAGAGLRRRAAAPRRADLRARPADGGGLPGVHRGGAQAGRTVLLSSHILAEVEALCDRVSIIRAGRTVETGTLAELRHLTRTAIDVETVRRAGRARRAARRARPRRSTTTARASTSTRRSSTRRCATSARSASAR